MGLKLNDRVVYKFAGIDGKKRQLLGRVTDLFRVDGIYYADVLLDRHISPEPIRVELLKPATDADLPEARHVLC